MLNVIILFWMVAIFCSMIPYIESILMIFQREGVRPIFSSYITSFSNSTQFPTSSFSCKNSYKLYQLRNTSFMVLCSCQQTKRCSFLMISMASGVLILLSISQSIKDRQWLFCKRSRRSCLVARQAEQRLILSLMMWILGEHRKASRLEMRSSTAEWHVCSCSIMLELIFLESYCSVNSQMKFIVKFINQSQQVHCQTDYSISLQICNNLDKQCFLNILWGLSFRIDWGWKPNNAMSIFQQKGLSIVGFFMCFEWPIVIYSVYDGQLIYLPIKRIYLSLCSDEIQLPSSLSLCTFQQQFI